jgi:hypothetical protein
MVEKRIIAASAAFENGITIPAQTTSGSNGYIFICLVLCPIKCVWGRWRLPRTVTALR